jgi:uncharacterized protein (DUF983 family)
MAASDAGREVRRRRCPRCGGPALINEDVSESRLAVCINCGHSFDPVSQARAPRSIHVPVTALVIIGCLGTGILAGIGLALLSNVPALGGWMLVLLGISLVTFMGAFEAGYMEGLRAWLRQLFQPRPS